MDPIYSQIKMFAFDWAPVDFACCDGQSMTVAENTALYSLLGTTFGGDGRTSFNLPDLRGRVPVHPDPSSSFFPQIGFKVGSEVVTITESTMPYHTHLVEAENGSPVGPTPNTAVDPSEGYFSNAETSVGDPAAVYTSEYNSTKIALSSDTCSPVGGGQSHSNMMPSIVINFCICTNGVYPQRN